MGQVGRLPKLIGLRDDYWTGTITREYDPRLDQNVADPELGGFQLQHKKLLDFQGGFVKGERGMDANLCSMENLTKELFFNKKKTPIKLKHLEKATTGCRSINFSACGFSST